MEEETGFLHLSALKVAAISNTELAELLLLKDLKGITNNCLITLLCGEKL